MFLRSRYAYGKTVVQPWSLCLQRSFGKVFVVFLRLQPCLFWCTDTWIKYALVPHMPSSIVIYVYSRLCTTDFNLPFDNYCFTFDQSIVRRRSVQQTQWKANAQLILFVQSFCCSICSLGVQECHVVWIIITRDGQNLGRIQISLFSVGRRSESFLEDGCRTLGLVSLSDKDQEYRIRLSYWPGCRHQVVRRRNHQCLLQLSRSSCWTRSQCCTTSGDHLRSWHTVRIATPCDLRWAASSGEEIRQCIEETRSEERWSRNGVHADGGRNVRCLAGLCSYRCRSFCRLRWFQRK